MVYEWKSFVLYIQLERYIQTTIVISNKKKEMKIIKNSYTVVYDQIRVINYAKDMCWEITLNQFSFALSNAFV